MVNISQKWKNVQIGNFRETRDDDEFVEEADDEEIGEEDINFRKPPLHPKRKPSSKNPFPVWEHFTKEASFNFQKCICNYHGQQFACDSKSNGTTHLNYLIKYSYKSILRASDKRQKTLGSVWFKINFGFSVFKYVCQI